jgi:prepilin-type N-terminal cleavage/methylation domain-containing protein
MTLASTTSPPARPRAGAGFTLVELMITVGILGVVAVMAAPNLQSMYRRGLVSQEMRRLFSTFLEAQSKARATGQPHSVCFDRTANTVIVKDATTTVSTTFLDAPSKTITYKLNGFGAGLPKPYDTSTPSTVWCTFCGGDGVTFGCLEFNGEGLFNSSTSGASKGSITLYDSTGITTSVETLVFIGHTGDLRLFRN